MDHHGSAFLARMQADACPQAFTQPLFKECHIGFGSGFGGRGWTLAQVFTHQVFGLAHVQLVFKDGLQNRRLGGFGGQAEQDTRCGLR